MLKCIPPVASKDLLLGQYVKSEDGTKPGYLDDPTVPAGSQTPTFAAAVLHINNERWEGNRHFCCILMNREIGVPFVLRCGKALHDQKAEIRIQFRTVPGDIFKSSARNELVIRVQPKEAVYVKFVNKLPGLGMDTTISELDLSYDRRYSDRKIPDAYESLILDCIQGDHSNFVRNDELDAAWKIFTPVLHQIDRGEIKPHPYPFGSRGPDSIATFIQQYGYVRHDSYEWQPTSSKI